MSYKPKTLTVSEGGTGATSFTAGAVLFGNGTSALSIDASNLFYDDTNNRLGIGLNNPTAGLDVNTSGDDVTSIAYANSGSSGSWPNVSADGNFNVAIRARNWISTTFGYVLESDERIKIKKNRSVSEQDLITLNKIEIVDYEFRDKIKFGNESPKKVIAQQVEEVYPIAVKKGVGVIPDIYKMADKVEFNAEKQELKIFLENHNLEKGEKIELVLDTKKQMFDIKESEQGWFIVSYNSDQDKIFVYGREVNDFRTVDYDALAMLNISATQELATQLEKMKQEIEDLKQKLQQLNK